jgi:hypothetical protein
MSNHYHLFVRASEKPLSEFMRFINSRYARYFNRRYSGSGYVFQGRFTSIPTQDQLYMGELVRYIHLNPIRAGICNTLRQLDTYPWCGHATLMGYKKNKFQTTVDVLRRFGGRIEDSREAYRIFLKQGLSGEESSETIESVRRNNRGIYRQRESSSWCIGNREFQVTVVRKDEERRLRLRRYQAEGWDLDRLSQKVSEVFSVNPESIKTASRHNDFAKARKLFAFAGFRILEYSGVEISRYLNVTPSAVSLMLEDGERIYTEKAKPHLII